jgi:hypothetical protein
MSKSIAWQIPVNVIEVAMKTQNDFEGPVKVWGAGFDEAANSVVVVMDIEDSDWASLSFDQGYEEATTSFLPIEDGGLPIQ